MMDSIQGSTLSTEQFAVIIKNSKFPKAYISTVDSILLAISSGPKSFYLAIEENSYFFISHISMALNKGLFLKTQLDYM